jgi:hypothetical protein
MAKEGIGEEYEYKKKFRTGKMDINRNMFFVFDYYVDTSTDICTDHSF